MSTPNCWSVFTSGSYLIRAWLFPFDATRGRLVEAWRPSLSRDGKKFAFRGIRGGNRNVWATSLSDGHEAPIIADDYARDQPQWSPDGTRLAYTREDWSKGTKQLMLWSSQSRNEEPLTDSGQSIRLLYDWSPDGKWLLMMENNASGRAEIWLLPVAAKPDADRNGRWIAFNAFRSERVGEASTIYVMSAAGGPWIRITDGKHWDDKPRWSPDGKIIYFLSERAGFLNVWGIRFDSVRARPVSEPFPVTTFSSPRLMVAKSIAPVSISLTQDRLV
jgi:Tol biopolymer transport system component